MNENTQEEPMTQEWHLDKRVSIATLASLLVLAVGGVMYIGRLEAQLVVQKTTIQALEQRIDRDSAQHLQTSVRIEARLDRIDANLLRLIQGYGKPKE